jgi:hypothetical protein
MFTGVLNMLEKAAGGKLYHCRFCRIQFWDRRRLQAEVMADEAAEREPETEGGHETETATPQTDRSDVE